MTPEIIVLHEDGSEKRVKIDQEVAMKASVILAFDDIMLTAGGQQGHSLELQSQLEKLAKALIQTKT